MPKCSICQQPYEGFGHTAHPVNEGRCCEDCNALVVIPARFAMLRAHDLKKEKTS